MFTLFCDFKDGIRAKDRHPRDYACASHFTAAAIFLLIPTPLWVLPLDLLSCKSQ